MVLIERLREHNFLNLIISIFIAGIIFYMSSQSFRRVSGGNGWEPIVYHFFIFSALTFFLILTLTKKSKDLMYFGMLLSFAYALFDEIHQYFVPGRTSSVFDIVIDSLGIVFALVMIGVLSKIKIKRHKK